MSQALFCRLTLEGACLFSMLIICIQYYHWLQTKQYYEIKLYTSLRQKKREGQSCRKGLWRDSITGNTIFIYKLWANHELSVRTLGDLKSMCITFFCHNNTRYEYTWFKWSDNWRSTIKSQMEELVVESKLSILASLIYTSKIQLLINDLASKYVISYLTSKKSLYLHDPQK